MAGSRRPLGAALCSASKTYFVFFDGKVEGESKLGYRNVRIEVIVAKRLLLAWLSLSGRGPGYLSIVKEEKKVHFSPEDCSWQASLSKESEAGGRRELRCKVVPTAVRVDPHREHRKGDTEGR
jgi:hypothetical protein